MVSLWLLLCSSLLGCFIIHSQITGVTSIPFVFDNIRDGERITERAPPSKKYYFPNPISWSKQYKRSDSKRGFSFPVPTSWSNNYKRADFTFSLPGYWSQSRGPMTQAGAGGYRKRGGSGSVNSAHHLVPDLRLCEDLPGLKKSLQGAQQAITKLQEDCAVLDLSIELCLTPAENDLLNELYVTAKKGAEQLGWCLLESDISS